LALKYKHQIDKKQEKMDSWLAFSTKV